MLSLDTGPPRTCQYWPENFGKKSRKGKATGQRGQDLKKDTKEGKTGDILRAVGGMGGGRWNDSSGRLPA
jgi:hypothetical protein